MSGGSAARGIPPGKAGRAVCILRGKAGQAVCILRGRRAAHSLHGRNVPADRNRFCCPPAVPDRDGCNRRGTPEDLTFCRNIPGMRMFAAEVRKYGFCRSYAPHRRRAPWDLYKWYWCFRCRSFYFLTLFHFLQKMPQRPVILIFLLLRQNRSEPYR